MAAARLEGERQRRRAARRARLKRRGAFAALGIAATLALVLLVAKWDRPADAGKASPKEASAAYGKSPGASGASARLKAAGVKAHVKKTGGEKSDGVADEFAAYLEAQGVKVEKFDMNMEVKGQRPVPPGTIRVYRNSTATSVSPPPDGKARPQTGEEARD